MTTPQPANAASPRFIPSASTPLPLSSIAPSTTTPTIIPSSSLPSIPSAPNASSTFPPATATTASSSSSLSHHILTSLSSLHLSLSTFRSSVDSQLLQHSQRYSDVRRELKVDVERVREEVRQEAEQQRREEAEDRRQWKRDMRERLTAAHRQLTHQPATAGGVLDEQRVRELVDERVSVLTAHYERTIADLTHRIQSLESRLTLTQHTAVPLPSPASHHPTALSLSLSPSSAALLSYPVRSLSPSHSPHTVQAQLSQQQPRGVLKKAVRFNEDVRQRMFSTAEEKERADDEYDTSPVQQTSQDEDEFDMFQTRTAGGGWSAAPSTSVSGVVSEVKEEAKVVEDEVRQSTRVSEVVQQQQQQQQAALDSEWSMLSTPSAADSPVPTAEDAREEFTQTASSTSYSYETADDSPLQQQREVQDEVARQVHESVSDSSSDEESEAGEEREMDSMDNTDDEPLDLTDLSAVTEQQPPLDTQPIDHQPHLTTQPTHSQQLDNQPTPHQPALLTNTTTHHPPASVPSDSDSDSDDDTVVTRSTPVLSHLPPLSSLQSSRYKSSLAIRSMKAAVSGAVVVGDSEAVQDILTGGRNKQQEEEQKEAEMEDEEADVPVTATTTAAAAAVLDGSSDDSDVEDGLGDATGRGGRWQLTANMERVFGSNSTAIASKAAVHTDSDDDDDDMIVVKG